MYWRHILALMVAGTLIGCEDGGALILDGDDDDVADDDDAADDDTGDDDTGDDDTGDDDTEEVCPWDGEYHGAAFIDMEYWTEECDASSEIMDCVITGTLLCGDEWWPFEFQMTGTAEYAGSASGDIQGDLGQGGDVNTTWEGEVDAQGFTGNFEFEIGGGGGGGNMEAWAEFEMIPN